MNELNLSDIAEEYTGTFNTKINDWIDDHADELPAIINVDTNMDGDNAAISGVIGGEEHSKDLTFIATGQGVIRISENAITTFLGPITGPPVGLFSFDANANVKLFHTEQLFLEWFGGGTGETGDSNRIALERASWTSAVGGGIPICLMNGTYAINGFADIQSGAVLVGNDSIILYNEGLTCDASGEIVTDKTISLEGIRFDCIAETGNPNIGVIGCEGIKVSNCSFKGNMGALGISNSSNVEVNNCSFQVPFLLESTDSECSDIIISNCFFKRTEGDDIDQFVGVTGSANYPINRLSIVNCVFDDIKCVAVNLTGDISQVTITGNVITRLMPHTQLSHTKAALKIATAFVIKQLVVTSNQISTRYTAHSTGSDPGSIYLSGQVKSAIISGNMLFNEGEGGAIRLNVTNEAAPLKSISIIGNNISNPYTNGDKYAFWFEGTGTGGIIEVIIQANALAGYIPDTEVLKLDENMEPAQKAGVFLVPNSNTIEGTLESNLHAGMQGVLNSLPQNRYTASSPEGSTGGTYYGALAFAEGLPGAEITYKIGSTTTPENIEVGFSGIGHTHILGGTRYIEILVASDGGSDPIIRCYLLETEGNGAPVVRRIAQLMKSGRDTGALIFESHYLYVDDNGYLRLADNIPSESNPGELIPYQGVAVANPASSDKGEVVKQFNALLTSLRNSSVIKT